MRLCESSRKIRPEQDFNRILTLHNEIARAISSNRDLDYHFVSDATAEIRKKASRLRTTSAFMSQIRNRRTQLFISGLAFVEAAAKAEEQPEQILSVPTQLLPYLPAP